MLRNSPKTTPKTTPKNTPNQPLWLLIIGAMVVLLILLLSDSSIQNSLSQGLQLTNSTNSNSTKTVSKNTDEKVEKVQVNRAVDGDTVELTDGRKVRYLNVDTPETVKSGTSVKCFGPEASEFNKKLMTKGRDIWMTADKAKTDRYGRELRFMFLKAEDTDDMSKSVNASLVKLGFGQAKFYSPNTTYKKDFEKWQFEAQQKPVGIWKSCPKPFED